MEQKVLSKSTIVTEGWVLEKDGKYWGEIYPGDGHCDASMGWTDDLTKISFSKGKKKPPHKGWFTYTGSHYIREMEKGEWRFVSWEQTINLVKKDPSNG